MKAKLEYIGEWTERDFSESYDKAQEMGVDELMQVIGVRGSVDLRILMAGYRTLLGCYFEDGSAAYSLEVLMPLMPEDGELDFAAMDKKMGILKEMKKKGYYLQGQCDGHVDCYKSGSLEELKKELENVGEILSHSPLERP